MSDPVRPSAESERAQNALPVLADPARAEQSLLADAAPVAQPLPSIGAGVGSPAVAVVPAVQAAAVAAGSFVAGAALVGLVHRRRRRAGVLPAAGAPRRRLGRRRARAAGHAGRGAGRAVELVQIVGSRSLLLDVHLLGGAGER
ncbi:MAG TPA: hypothetical protein VMF09_14790 [Solirubrobacteraceae bacterium]|nr:hypothetical protein [Solirubrobacteraceae bacterium]